MEDNDSEIRELVKEQGEIINKVIIKDKETHYHHKTDKICMMCGKSDWVNIDYLRQKSQKHIICNNCNFITFDRFLDQSEYKTFYNNDYRKNVITYSNLVTANRKIGYHNAFIKDYLIKNKNLTICDIGAGIGYFVKYCKDEFGHKNAHGTEYDETMRIYAKNAFDLDLDEEFDDTLKYDLVSMYHSIEHVFDPINLLKKIRNSLNKNGKLYIAVPFWMDELMNFGGGAFVSYDEYFHENHINCWSKTQFRQFLFQNGFKIVKEAHKLYGYTVLCEKCEPGILPEYEKKEKLNDILFQLENMKRASTAFINGDFLEAMRLYTKFPDAYMAECGKQYQNFDMQLKLLAECERVCLNTVVHHLQAGVVFYQRKQYKNAEKEYKEAQKYKPNDDFLLTHIGVLYKVVGFNEYVKNKVIGEKILKNAIGYFSNAININPKRTEELNNEICYIFSRLNMDGINKENKFKQPSMEGTPQVAFKSTSQGI